jgi:oligosaccharide repeat unit polymerase
MVIKRFFLISIHLIFLLVFLLFDDITSKKIALVILFFWGTFSVSFVQEKILSFFTLFIFSFSFFLLSRIFLDVFFNIDFSQTISFSQYSYNSEVQFEMLTILFVHLWAIFLGSFFTVNKLLYPKYPIIFNTNLFRFSKRFFFFSLVPTFYVVITKLLYVLENGYLSLFMDNKESNSLFLIILSSLFSFSFYLNIISKPPIQKLRPLIFIYVTYLLINLATGQRGFALTELLIIFYVVTQIYNIKINLLRMGFIFIFILTSSIYLGIARQEADFDIDPELLNLFFYGQGISLQVLGYSIEYQNILNYEFIHLFSEFRSVLESIYYRLIGGKSEITQSAYLSMKEFGHLGLKLSYLNSPEKFFLGKGLGTSYLAEVFLVGGKFLVLIIGIIIGYLFQNISSKINSNANVTLFVLIFGGSFLFFARDSLLAFISTNIIFIFLYILFKLFTKYTLNSHAK